MFASVCSLESLSFMLRQPCCLDMLAAGLLVNVQLLQHQSLEFLPPNQHSPFKHIYLEILNYFCCLTIKKVGNSNDINSAISAF